ncbi:hypothetical protein BC628DRAFT_262864 [Trametes gibbosa]|nr:hypothetical protein BC628DRAFT_262864 [Trametes gibbosa]
MRPTFVVDHLPRRAPGVPLGRFSKPRALSTSSLEPHHPKLVSNDAPSSTIISKNSNKELNRPRTRPACYPRGLHCWGERGWGRGGRGRGRPGRTGLYVPRRPGEGALSASVERSAPAHECSSQFPLARTHGLLSALNRIRIIISIAFARALSILLCGHGPRRARLHFASLCPCLYFSPPYQPPPPPPLPLPSCCFRRASPTQYAVQPVVADRRRPQRATDPVGSTPGAGVCRCSRLTRTPLELKRRSARGGGAGRACVRRDVCWCMRLRPPTPARARARACPSPSASRRGFAGGSEGRVRTCVGECFWFGFRHEMRGLGHCRRRRRRGQGLQAM